MRKMMLVVLAVMTLGMEMGCGMGEPLGMSEGERMRYTDQKGHYRPELAARGEVVRAEALGD